MSTPISVVGSALGATTVIRLIGEVDITNVQEVALEVGALCDRAVFIALELSELYYLDSAGVRFVDDLACRCERLGAEFLVVVPKAAMTRRLLELTLPQVALADDLESGTEQRG